MLVRTVMVKDSTLYTLIDNEYGAHEMVHRLCRLVYARTRLRLGGP